MREHAFDFLFKAHPTPMFIYERESLRIVDVNESALGLYGYSRDEFLRMTIKDIRPPEEVPTLLKTLVEVRTSGQGYHRNQGVFTHWKKDRTHLQVEVVSYGIELKGKQLRITCVHDITERVRMEERLRDSETRFRNIFASNMVGMAVSRRDGTMVDINDAFLQMLGFSREDFERGAVDWLALTPPEYLPAERKAHAEADAQGFCTPFRKEYFRKDGSRVPVLVGGRFLQGSSEEVIAYAVDMSENQRAEQARLESERQFKALVEAAPVIFFRTDEKGLFTLVEGQGMARLRKDPRSALGRTVQERYRNRPDLREYFHRAMAGETLRFEAEVDDEWFDSLIAPMRDQLGKINGVVGVSTVITERRRMEERAREAESKLKFTLSHVPIVLHALDRNGIVTLLEGAGLTSFGVQPAELLGRSVFEIYPPDSKIVEEMRSVLAGETISGERQEGDGWYERYYAPVHDQKGQVDGMVGVVWNVTERKLAEKAWQETEARLRFTLTHAPLALFALDRNGVTTLSEGAALKSLGLQPGEMVGKSALEMFPSGSQSRRLLERALSGEEVSEENQVGDLWFGVHFRPILDASGQPDGMVGVTWEITERRQAEKRALAAEENLRFTIANAPLTLFATNKLGVITLSEGAALASLGIRPGELVGRNVLEMYASEPDVLEAFQRVLRGESVSDEQVFSGICFQRQMTPILDASGAVDGLVGVAWDVTERKLAEQNLERINEELRDALRARDEFLSVAAHELRTPLTTLRMQMELVESFFRPNAPAKPTAEQLRRVAELGEIEFDRLSKLIHNLLDVARIRSGKLVLQRTRTDLAEVAKLTAERFAAQAGAAGSPLSVEAREPVLGDWDRYRIEQILVNLVFNAIKYAPRSPIQVRAWREGKHAVIEVADQGPGISEADQARIFDRFERLGNAMSGGMGLGLFISKEIAEAHGGRLILRSTMGKGSVFRLELPA